jgi:type IV pilus assembly protein PilM
MAYGRPVWGIDVGQRALKALKLRWTPAGPEVLALDIIEHPKILSQPDADEDQLVRDALEKFTGRNATRGDRVVVSVPGQAAFARFIKLPPVEKKKIPEIVRYEARQQIPFAIEDVLWDYQPIGNQPSGLETEIGLFAMKKDVVNDFVSNFVMAKIEIEAVQVAPLALYNFLVVDEQLGQGATVLLDLGAENTNLLITDGQRIWLRNIPIGGNNFTRTLSKARKLTFAKAEEEKKSIRQSKDSREIFEAIQPVFAELLAEVQRSMGYFTSLHRDVRVERILGMGSAFRTPGLRRFLAQNLQYRVDELAGFKRLADSPLLATPEAKEHLLALPTAYGLALQGLEVAPLTVSLLPKEIVRQRIISRKKPYAAAAVAALALAVGASFLGAVAERDRAAASDLLTQGDQIINQAAAYEGEYTRAVEDARRRENEVGPLQQTVADRNLWPTVIHEFLSILPEDKGDSRWLRLVKLDYEPEQTKPEEWLKAKGRTQPVDPLLAGQPCWVFQFEGYTIAPDATTFIDDGFLKPLERSRLFRYVVFKGNGLEQTTREIQTHEDTPERAGAGRLKTQTQWRLTVEFLCVASWARQLAETGSVTPTAAAPPGGGMAPGPGAPGGPGVMPGPMMPGPGM